MNKESIKILLIEPNPNDARLIKEFISQINKVTNGAVPTYRLVHSERLEVALAFLTEVKFDVVLADLNLPGSLDAVFVKQVQKASPNTPIIVLSGGSDGGLAFQAAKSGAQGYLPKGDLNSDNLKQALEQAIKHKAIQVDTDLKLARQAAELEKRNLELDAFAHTMAHQIQGLLGHIIGYTSYLEMHYGPDMDASGQKVIQRILQSGRKMSNVVNELLLLAYLDADDVPLTSLNMERIVNEARRRMAFNAEEAQAQFIVQDNWPHALGYAAWIEEVWVNYISNAIKYGGSPPIIKLSWKDMQNGMVRFSVTDNGIGIDETEKAKLFKRHSRLLQIDVKGEGLGLFIVKRFVSKCQGEVGVESAPGKGSRFWFSLPKSD
jgi:signal transduction histidine kinase